MARKKILWLTSWYPNKEDPFDGDFIQRHARAAAISNDIHVIFVKAVSEIADEEVSIREATGLTEEIIYFRPGKVLLGKLGKFLSWQRSMKRAASEYVQRNGKPDRVHVHVAWRAGLIGNWFQKRFGLPYLLSEHWGMYDAQLNGFFYSMNPLLQNRLRTVYQSAEAVIAVSKYLSGTLLHAVARKADYLIPNVVDTTLFHPSDKRYDRFTFLHVSNMEPVKRVPLLLDAFELLVKEEPALPLQLILIGNRSEEHVLRAGGSGLLNSTIFFRGEIPYTEVADEMKRCHCLVVPSISETFSCVTAEALCCGLPILASTGGALTELVNETNGITARFQSPEDLKQKMLEMYQKYKDFQSASIAAEAAGRYSYGTVMKQFEALYGDTGSKG